MNRVQRIVVSVGILLGLYWLAIGALMGLRPDLVAPQAFDLLHLNHGATLLSILYILAALIVLVSCLILFFRARSQTYQQPLPSENVRPARVLALGLVIPSLFAVPLIALVPNLAIVWYILTGLGPAGVLIAYLFTSPSGQSSDS